MFHINPVVKGLTELPTWYWVTGATGQVTASANIRGYTVRATVHPIGYSWTYGDGWSGESPDSGDLPQPSVTHTYTETGDYTVTVTVRWVGRFTMTGHGLDRTETLPAVNERPAARKYAVQEIRSVEVSSP